MLIQGVKRITIKYTQCSTSKRFAAIGVRTKRTTRKMRLNLDKNNNINSRNQTRPESGINLFSPKTNSFLDRCKNVIIKCFIQEGIRLWREEIYTGFWPGLIPGINIIIFYRDSILFFLLFSLFLLQ